MFTKKFLVDSIHWQDSELDLGYESLSNHIATQLIDRKRHRFCNRREGRVVHFQLHANQPLVVWRSNPRQSDWNANLHVSFAHCNVVESIANLVLCCQSKYKIATRCLVALDSITFYDNFVRTGIDQALDACIIHNCITFSNTCRH